MALTLELGTSIWIVDVIKLWKCGWKR